MLVHRWSSSNTFWLRFVRIVAWAVDAANSNSSDRICMMIPTLLFVEGVCGPSFCFPLQTVV